MGHIPFSFEVKCNIFRLNRRLRVYFYLYAADFKYLFHLSPFFKYWGKKHTYRYLFQKSAAYKSKFPLIHILSMVAAVWVSESVLMRICPTELKSRFPFVLVTKTKLLEPSWGLSFSCQAFKARLGLKANWKPKLGSGLAQHGI